MVDYSKWKDIEISDDEDDTHPNIDTPSLFRWRHQARVERMEEQKKQKEELERIKEQTVSKVEETKKKIATLEKEQANPEDLNTLKKSLQELELEEQKVKAKEDELKKKEKLTPWNVDTIAQAGFTKTVINKKPRRRPDEEEQSLPDDVRELKMKEFVKTNEKSLKKFGMLRRYDDSKQYLQENSHLVCENTANYLKHELMEHVAHQCICMQYILELSKQLDVDPRACVGSFFSRIQIADVEYKKSFDDELEAFKERIRKRAQEKVAEALKEAEEEEKKARLGPGGLDPVEVFESLPEPLQKCFEAQDIPLLQQTIAAMPEDEAKYHMRRCIDSGLWVPDAKSKESESSTSEDKPEVATPTPDPE
ncbi:Similar to Cdc37: Hsp90 co-chaperone Cdc37 (Drosophila virilis) [Cotesia congregata]|uniref:Hsp90 co-chaperone Cdc37 n=1 Tax=Cotesia congregata TaxID=51543 RepID=A0A8J2HPF0_COTCN|nr:Similar to Cdc37: Hsp90 co-chaperone Cdc37 (Drosophila virilis) [Cotesia congregata]